MTGKAKIPIISVSDVVVAVAPLPVTEDGLQNVLLVCPHMGAASYDPIVVSQIATARNMGLPSAAKAAVTAWLGQAPRGGALILGWRPCTSGEIIPASPATGKQYVIVVGAATITYVALSTDATSDVAAALATQIDSVSGVTATSVGGVVTITQDSLATPVVVTPKINVSWGKMTAANSLATDLAAIWDKRIDYGIITVEGVTPSDTAGHDAVLVDHKALVDFCAENERMGLITTSDPRCYASASVADDIRAYCDDRADQWTTICWHNDPAANHSGLATMSVIYGEAAGVERHAWVPLQNIEVADLSEAATTVLSERGISYYGYLVTATSYRAAALTTPITVSYGNGEIYYPGTLQRYRLKLKSAAQLAVYNMITKTPSKGIAFSERGVNSILSQVESALTGLQSGAQKGIISANDLNATPRFVGFVVQLQGGIKYSEIPTDWRAAQTLYIDVLASLDFGITKVDVSMTIGFDVSGG